MRRGEREGERGRGREGWGEREGEGGMGREGGGDNRAISYDSSEYHIVGNFRGCNFTH